MVEPATTGKICKTIEDMQIGDYIVCKYIASNSTVGTFSELGISTAKEIALAGSTTPNGTFYFLMVDKSKYGGVLVADRVIQSNIQWFELNVGRVIQGKPLLFDNTKGIIRSLTGGVAYAAENGNRSYSEDEGGGIRGEVYGACSTNNEWEKYIVNFPLDKVQEGKTVMMFFIGANVPHGLKTHLSIIDHLGFLEVGEELRDFTVLQVAKGLLNGGLGQYLNIENREIR